MSVFLSAAEQLWRFEDPPERLLSVPLREPVDVTATVPGISAKCMYLHFVFQFLQLTMGGEGGWRVLLRKHYPLRPAFWKSVTNASVGIGCLKRFILRADSRQLFILKIATGPGGFWNEVQHEVWFSIASGMDYKIIFPRLQEAKSKRRKIYKHNAISLSNFV